MRFYDDCGYFYERKPNLTTKKQKELMAEFKNTFKGELKSKSKGKSFYDFKEAALLEAESLKGEDKGPFVMFLAGWNLYNGETPEQREQRLITNYIRHNLTSYDHKLEETLEEWWVDKEFFTQLWDLVMSVIADRFPEARGAFKRGKIAKSAYEEFKEGLLFFEEDDYYKFEDCYNEANADYLKILEERAIEEEKREAEYEELMEKEKAENAQDWKEWRNKRSEVSKIASKIFKVGDEVKIKRKGHYYEGKVSKVNRVTIAVDFTLKASKTPLTENFYACYLYEDNMDRFPKIEGYEKFTEEPRPLSFLYNRW